MFSRSALYPVPEIGCAVKGFEAKYPLLCCVFALLMCFLLCSLNQLIRRSVILQLLQNRLREGARRGEEGVLLDGFPRTRSQAESLLTFSDVQLALNLSLREDVSALPEQCLDFPSMCSSPINVLLYVYISPLGCAKAKRTSNAAVLTIHLCIAGPYSQVLGAAHVQTVWQEFQCGQH